MFRVATRLSVLIAVLALMVPPVSAAPADVHARIVGGSDAAASAWPAFARLTISRGGLPYLCGGTLITPTVVLTAAHCVENADAALSTVSIGGTPVSSSTSIAWSSYISHPNYNSSTFQYDVALITLASTVVVTPMPLIAPAQDALLTAGASLMVAGYGRTSTSGSISLTLKEVAIPLVVDATCQSNYNASNYLYDTATMICAGADGLDSCYGDSGGPLILSIDGTRTLVGDVSWGPLEGCAISGLPGVYGRITAFRPWIATRLAAPTIASVTNAGSVVTVTWTHASAAPANVPLTFLISETTTRTTKDADATQAELTITAGGPKTISVSAVSSGFSQAAAWTGTPTPTRSPIVSARLLGDATVGKTLTVDAVTDDPWADAVSYQWTRAGQAIVGATAATFTPTAADAAATIGVVVSARNGAGVGTATATAEGLTTQKPTVAARTLRLRGTRKVGRFLRVARPVVTAYPAPTRTYQWLRNGRALKDKTRAFYRVTAADRGQRIACRITLTNSAGSTRIRSAAVTID